MATVGEYATYIIDISEAMLRYKKGLNREQFEHIKTIRRRTIDFITTFMQKQNAPPQEFGSYLNHDALSPITVIIGYAEVLLMGMEGDLPEAYQEALQNVRDCGYYLQEVIEETRDDVLGVLVSLGLR